LCEGYEKERSRRGNKNNAFGGCEYCVASLLKLFCKEFPDYIQQARKAFKERFGKELDYFKSGECGKRGRR